MKPALALGLALFAACDGEARRSAVAQPFTKRHIDLPTGIDVTYVEAGDPAGETVILLHGYTDSRRSFYPTVRHLVALRPELRIFALDQRGHGESSMPSPERCRAAPERCFRPADFAADVLAFMDAKGIQRAHLVGHSMGSVVAQEVVLTHPHRVLRLVLMGAFARGTDHPGIQNFMLAGLVEGPWKDALVRRGYAFPADVYEHTPLDADSGAEAWMLANWVVEPPADPAFLGEIAPETARTRIGTWLGVPRALLAVDNTERLKDLRVPTLVIWGTQDNMVPESPDQELLRASLAAAAERCLPHWVWKRYGKKPLPASGQPDADIAHNLQWGAAEAVATDLAAFLRDGGEPTRDLYYADPQNAQRVLTAPGEATLIEGRGRSCPA